MSSLSFHGSRDQVSKYFSTTRVHTSILSEDEDTVFALSSGGSESPTAVAVIRVTGSHSHSLLQRLTPKQKPVPTRTAVVRNLYDDSGLPLDQALVLKFDGPRSFTGEDVVELHCHGSRAVVQGILNTLGKHARLAERGEFTQRAFASGKLNLLEVEALADLLTADTQLQRQQALHQLDGRLSNLYDGWRGKLIKGLAHAEAVIDFGDDEHLGDDDDSMNYDGAQLNVWGAVGESMGSLASDMKHHLADERRGELVRNGLKIAIVGPPNAGKSSLFNILAKRDAAIVSPIEGTTRDVLELALDLGGVRCTLSDTAGVREESEDIIEKEGMKRARSTAKHADILVAMIDATDIDNGVAALVDVLPDPNKASQLILAINKFDLLKTEENSKLHLLAKEYSHRIPHNNGTYIFSCETSQGVDHFLDALTDRVLKRVLTPHTADQDMEPAMITRERHRQHVEAAVTALDRFSQLSIQGSMAVDIAAEELRLAASELGRITGAVDVEDVLDVLFTDFCIGK
eukprot:CAMPEP_0194197252 /NCGR_PEP_ID=MMETSP0154-20130528/77103_1 /TAXON_ID=1049557 /ORGANISM="Thalassiothrix antarctica, Strain L6-D1" /LENGTH=515 /DNA_ID=CAMNT_0038921907 /DNA_START=116 /DNA_END=1663 /DNA_ORIENTATION=+